MPTTSHPSGLDEPVGAKAMTDSKDRTDSEELIAAPTESSCARNGAEPFRPACDRPTSRFDALPERVTREPAQVRRIRPDGAGNRTRNRDDHSGPATAHPGRLLHDRERVGDMFEDVLQKQALERRISKGQRYGVGCNSACHTSEHLPVMIQAQDRAALHIAGRVSTADVEDLAAGKLRKRPSHEGRRARLLRCRSTDNALLHRTTIDHNRGPLSGVVLTRVPT